VIGRAARAAGHRTIRFRGHRAVISATEAPSTTAATHGPREDPCTSTSARDCCLVADVTEVRKHGLALGLCQ
jgi:hypothetical protein